MQIENYCRNDGSVALTDLAKILKVREKWILNVSSPAYDKIHKRRFVVIEKIHPDGYMIVIVVALGGHSVFIANLIAQYQLGAEFLDIYGQLVHNTSAKKQIADSGFLSASHRIVICVKEWPLGIFFLNRFSDVYCTGSWEWKDSNLFSFSSF